MATQDELVREMIKLKLTTAKAAKATPAKKVAELQAKAAKATKAATQAVKAANAANEAVAKASAAAPVKKASAPADKEAARDLTKKQMAAMAALCHLGYYKDPEGAPVRNAVADVESLAKALRNGTVDDLEKLMAETKNKRAFEAKTAQLGPRPKKEDMAAIAAKLLLS